MNQSYEIKSPDANIVLRVESGNKLTWSVQHKGQPIIKPSSMALHLGNGEVLGYRATVSSSEIGDVDTEFKAINYRRTVVKDRYTSLTLHFEGDFGVEFRVYDDAVAYRFFVQKTDELTVENEEANFNFTAGHDAFIPYLWDYRDGQIFNASFESPYTEQKLSEFTPGSLAILPLLVDVGSGKKVVILEVDLEDYPGMYLNLNQTGIGFQGVYAPYPLETRVGGFAGINLIPTKRADYIAKIQGPRTLPWRVIAISEADKDLLNNDIVQKLASPPRLDDVSWVVPGQVAWDWWDDYNITHVDFKAGMNTPTFKYYIDFAAANKAKYIIIDAGWSEGPDLTKLNPDVDVPEIVAYGKEKGIGVILWASWYAITRQMHEVFPKYAAMGIKGWKIDFIDRDDQIAVASTYEIAKLAARYNLMVDYHGIFKPTGLQRTYPNVVGYEGVYGLENFKWADMDAPRYAVTIPYTRNMAGPMDYTSGAMINATQADFKARNHAPMSKGTRCHQLAQYVVFEVPIQMLSDSPTLYMREQECTDFITSIPTIFDETVPLDGKVGEYVAVARQKDGIWYVGAMTNWDARELTLDLSFLEEGQYRAVVFKDGINANRGATDYKKEIIAVTSGDRLKIHLSNGGGWAARIEKVK
ncbi:MAG: glycoside hydrolase family 97 protein [Anaerolineae bacterium]|nr:glycoside hydrolase family 97 protein [Anaerolineae bacterium]